MYINIHCGNLSIDDIKIPQNQHLKDLPTYGVLHKPKQTIFVSTIRKGVHSLEPLATVSLLGISHLKCQILNSIDKETVDTSGWEHFHETGKKTHDKNKANSLWKEKIWKKWRRYEEQWQWLTKISKEVSQEQR